MPGYNNTPWKAPSLGRPQIHADSRRFMLSPPLFLYPTLAGSWEEHFWFLAGDVGGFAKGGRSQTKVRWCVGSQTGDQLPRCGWSSTTGFNALGSFDFAVLGVLANLAKQALGIRPRASLGYKGEELQCNHFHSSQGPASCSKSNLTR